MAAWYELFPQIVNMSLTASVAIIVVILARELLKKVPKIFSYILWAVVLFRLLCPVSIASELSFFRMLDVPVAENGRMEYVPEQIAGVGRIQGEGAEASVPFSGIEESGFQRPAQLGPQPAAALGKAPVTTFTILWLLGAGALLVYSTARLILLKGRLRACVRLKENIYLADHIHSPFVLGMISPRIYLPSDLSAGEQDYVIMHEKYHIRRGDHVVKLLAFMALCIHWFNPLVWLAFTLSGRDMEMSCDEAVMKKMGSGIRVAYSKSLLRFAAGQKRAVGSPLAFGEGEIKGRVRNVMGYKKPKYWMVMAAVLCCALVGICLFTNPKESTIPHGNEGTPVQENLHQEQKASAAASSEADSGIPEETLAAAEEDGEARPKQPGSLTAPPQMRLQEALSSSMDYFFVTAETYSWNYLSEDGIAAEEAGGGFLAAAAKEMEWMKLPDYNRMDYVAYLASFEIDPDRMTVREYDLLKLDNMEPVCLSETVLEATYFMELEPRRVYEIHAEWDEDNLGVNGFYGEAYYAFATYDVTSADGEEEASGPVSLEAHVKEVMADRPNSVVISSDTDDFPGAFILEVPKEVYDVGAIAGGEAFSITMQATDEVQDGKLPVYRAIAMESLDEEIQAASVGAKALAVAGAFQEEVNNLEGVRLTMEKFSASGGDLEIANFSEKELVYGDWFDIQVEMDGIWHSLAYITENIAFHSIAYMAPAGETKVKEVDWTVMYGELPKGEYRIVTDIMDHRAPGDYTKYYIAALFEIQ